jgi:hypothetical protein
MSSTVRAAPAERTGIARQDADDTRCTTEDAFRRRTRVRHAVPMQRDVTAHLNSPCPTPPTWSSRSRSRRTTNPITSFTALLDGVPVPTTTFADHSGTRFQRLQAGAERSSSITARTSSGRESDRGSALRPVRVPPAEPLRRERRPLPTAAAEFAGIEPAGPLAAVSSWVGTQLSYVPGASGPTDGAVQTLLSPDRVSAATMPTCAPHSCGRGVARGSPPSTRRV